MHDVFPFVIGCPRSGTTLLRAMLDSHPELATPPEAYFVVPALRQAARYTGPSGVDVESLLGYLETVPSFRKWALEAAAIARLRAEAPATVPDTLRLLYAEYARQRGKTRYADKTPQHVLHVDLLVDAFTEARFVHLVRDGRDVVPSLLEMPVFPSRFPAAALYWRTRVLAGRRAGERLGPQRYHELRYEDLVAEPEAELRRLCRFLGLRYDAQMLDYPARAAQIVVGMGDPRYHQGVQRAPTRGRDWRQTLVPRRVALFEALAGDVLVQCGYELSGRPRSRRVRAEAWSWRVGTATSRRARRVGTRLRRRLGRDHRPRPGAGGAGSGALDRPVGGFRDD